MSLYGRVILGNFAHPTLQRGEHKAQGLLHLQHLQHHLQHFEPIQLQLSNDGALHKAKGPPYLLGNHHHQLGLHTALSQAFSFIMMGLIYWIGMISSSSKSTQNSSTELPSPKIWTSTLWGKVIFEPTCPNNSGGGKLIRQFSKVIMSIFWGVPLKMSKDDGWYIICGIMNNMWGVVVLAGSSSTTSWWREHSSVWSIIQGQFPHPPTE